MAVADQKRQAEEKEMSVQKKSLISQRAAVTKAIVASPEKEFANPRVTPKVAPKMNPKIGTKVGPKIATTLRSKVKF
jgi:hypothetical protein